MHRIWSGIGANCIDCDTTTEIQAPHRGRAVCNPRSPSHAVAVDAATKIQAAHRGRAACETLGVYDKSESNQGSYTHQAHTSLLAMVRENSHLNCVNYLVVERSWALTTEADFPMRHHSLHTSCSTAGVPELWLLLLLLSVPLLSSPPLPPGASKA